MSVDSESRRRVGWLTVVSHLIPQFGVASKAGLKMFDQVNFQTKYFLCAYLIISYAEEKLFHESGRLW